MNHSNEEGNPVSYYMLLSGNEHDDIEANDYALRIMNEGRKSFSFKNSSEGANIFSLKENLTTKRGRFENLQSS